MYMPENKGWSGTTVPKRRGSSPRKQRVSVAGALVLLLLLIVAALLMNKPESESAHSGMSHDLGKLWEWTDAALNGGAEASDWHLRWRLETNNAKAFDELVDTIFRDDKGRELVKTVTNGGLSVHGEVPAYGGARISVHRAEQTEEGEVLMVLLDRKGGSGLTLKELDASAAAVAELLEAVTPDLQPSIKTHGYAASEEAGRRIERLAQGKEVERYDDGRTTSLTLRSAILRLSQPMGNGRSANMQIAVHPNTERDEAEITVGVPLLTGEFGSVFADAQEDGEHEQ
ncbi:YwmB family TATA-box binding protein [Paenibacillus soyae]|uniref:YwmB family TATA-box binding protein n=1 Tax=Paenibacillus soyae TaxID=2969249 RepID=A0A9X2ML22_9BACL|nr:YwmB family TATA-box binding protein [Paenibacillus soyae]MCR2802275.1 YwmB family TATA-box binding protein [Paenibacillus soyae]